MSKVDIKLQAFADSLYERLKEGFYDISVENKVLLYESFLKQLEEDFGLCTLPKSYQYKDYETYYKEHLRVSREQMWERGADFVDYLTTKCEEPCLKEAFEYGWEFDDLRAYAKVLSDRAEGLGRECDYSCEELFDDIIEYYERKGDLDKAYFFFTDEAKIEHIEMRIDSLLFSFEKGHRDTREELNDYIEKINTYYKDKEVNPYGEFKKEYLLTQGREFEDVIKEPFVSYSQRQGQDRL